MTTVFLVSNNCFLNDKMVYADYIDYDMKRKYRPLTSTGEKNAITIAKKKSISNIGVVYSSSFFSSIDTAKYFIENKELDMIIDRRLDDRRVGNLTDSTLNLRNLQEHDFSYKLSGGESLNDVKKRMTNCLKEILNKNEGENILIYTHNIPITVLLSVWCEKGFNFEEKLILNYDDKVILDGSYAEKTIVKLEFEGQNLQDIERIG